MSANIMRITLNMLPGVCPLISSVFSKPYTFVLDQDGLPARIGRIAVSGQSKPTNIN